MYKRDHIEQLSVYNFLDAYLGICVECFGKWLVAKFNKLEVKILWINLSFKAKLEFLMNTCFSVISEFTGTWYSKW